MCRYRETHYSECNHVVTDPEPYLPCGPEFCKLTEAQHPIHLKKNGSCGAADCPLSTSARPAQNGGGTSWERTNELRRTVSVTNTISKLTRKITSSKKKKPVEQYSSGFD